VWVDNVVATLPGADAALAKEWVVLGAHYDHIGVDQRGRIGVGADDNASGVAALLEAAEALALARPARSILICAFSGEEDGLLGSRALAKALPMPQTAIVAMLNLDMIGRGDPKEVAVIGLVQNPDLEDVLLRARKLERSGIERFVLRQGEELFQRSDHYSFHQLGVPVLFFFEGLPIEKNGDYHTWRDVPARLDWPKILHTSRIVYGTAWLLSTDPSRPPAPRG
jgi:Zn-dependent M28 family amino/carboxypeptidase